MRHLIWFAVIDAGMCYALPTLYSEERCRHRRRLGAKIIGEYSSRVAAELAIEGALKDA